MKYTPKDWVSAYEDQGFVIVPDLIDTGTLSTLRQSIEKITGGLQMLSPELREKVFLEREHVKNCREWYEGIIAEEDCGNSMRQIADLPWFDPLFEDLISYRPMLDVLESTEFSFTLMVARPKVARVGNGVRNGLFHRDTPDQQYDGANVIQTFLYLDDVTPDNGPTLLVPGSHKVSDEEARQRRWMEVDGAQLSTKVPACAPAGSALFFSSKILHAAGHNRSARDRATINLEWAGPGVSTTRPPTFACEGLKPRSKSLS
jgi:hypothetical protein